MGLLLRPSRSLFCVLVFALALLPSAAAQLSVSPSAIDATAPSGSEVSATLAVTNNGTSDADYLLRISDSSAVRLPANALARTAAFPGAALQMRSAPPSPRLVALRSARQAAASGGTATDSLFYDDGSDLPESFLGTSFNEQPLFAAQRFAPGGAFSLDGVRLYVSAVTLDDTYDPSDLTVLLEVFDAPDPSEPRAGTLLAAVDAGVQAEFQGFIEVALPESLGFEAGEEFFVVATLIGGAFPIGIDLSGAEDAAQRSLSSLTGEAGTWIANEDITGDIATPFLIRALSGSTTSSGWLSAAPSSGTVAPGATATIDLTLDASRLFAGTYTKVIQVVEAATGAATGVPVTFTVTGEAMVEVDRTAASFGEVFVGSTSVETFFLINLGTAPLTVESVTSSDAAFETRSLAGTILPPFSEIPLSVAFAPTDAGTFAGTVTIATDAGTVALAVDGSAVVAPEAVVTPAELSVSLAPGANAALPLSIANTGGSTLTYSATVRGASGAAADSLFYDDGDEIPDSFLGTGEASFPLFAAQRFTADDGFNLWGLRLFVNTFPFDVHAPDSTGTGETADLDLFAEVYTAPDPFDPNAGELLATARAAAPAGTQGFVEMAMERALTFEPGASFFVVVRFTGNAFPIGLDDAGSGDFEGRTFFALDPAEWSPSLDYLGDGATDTILLRALSGPPGQRLVTLDPQRGDLAPGADSALNVLIDATDTERGSYARSIVIRTNDPEQREIVVPVTVVVEGQGVMPLSEGWNLVSWNVELDDLRLETALASVWSEVEQIQLYRDDTWVTYAIAPDAEATMTMRPGEAVWVKLRAAADLTMDGPAMAMDTMPLDAGLNAVAYLPGEANVPAHAFASVAEATESIQSFHSTGVAYAPGLPDAFQTLGRVQPGMGYLVRTSAPVRLDYPLVAAPAAFAGIPLSTLVAAEREAAVTPTPAWISAWGQNLGVAPGTLVTAVDPDGVVCGAFTVQADGALGLMAIYADDPTTDPDEGARPGDRITLRTDTGVLADDLVWSYAGAVVEVTNVVVSTEEPGSMPTAFALHGSYPNPFAASTTVAFDLPESADVQIDIYDSVGRQVATLMSETVAAGTHTTTWDATRMASGLYLVVLRAGDYTATQRAVVMR